MLDEDFKNFITEGRSQNRESNWWSQWQNTVAKRISGCNTGFIKIEVTTFKN